MLPTKDALQQLKEAAAALTQNQIQRRFAQGTSESSWEPPDPPPVRKRAHTAAEDKKGSSWEPPEEADNAKAAVDKKSLPVMKAQPKLHARPMYRQTEASKMVIPSFLACIKLWPKKIHHSVAVNRKYYIAATLFNLVLSFRGQPQMSKLCMGRLEPVNRGSPQM